MTLCKGFFFKSFSSLIDHPVFMQSTALVSQSMHKMSFGVSRGFVTIREGLMKWIGHFVTQAMFLPCRLGYRDFLAFYKHTVISWGPILLQTVCQDPEAPGPFVHISVTPAASDKKKKHTHNHEARMHLKDCIYCYIVHKLLCNIFPIAFVSMLNMCFVFWF